MSNFDPAQYARSLGDAELQVIFSEFGKTLAVADLPEEVRASAQRLYDMARDEMLRRIVGVETGPVRVEKTLISAYNEVVYSVFVPSGLMGNHSSIMSFDGQWFGRVGTERLPADLDALKPGTTNRIEKVGEFFAGRYDAAYKAILLVHPDAADGHRSMGEITTKVKEWK